MTMEKKKLIEKFKKSVIQIEEKNNKRYKRLEQLFGRKKEIECYKKINILQQLNKNTFSLEEVDIIIELFSKGEFKVIVDNDRNLGYIKEGIDESLELTNPGVWIWSKHPEINETLYECIENEKENLNKICLDLEELNSVLKWTVINVLNKGMELKEKNIGRSQISGGGWNYLSKTLIIKMVELLRNNVKFSKGKAKNIDILRYLEEKNCDINKWEEIIVHFNTYIESKENIQWSIYNLCNGVMGTLITKRLVLMKEGKFVISNYNEVSEYPALLYKLNLPKLTDVTYSNNIDLIKRKQNRVGTISLTSDHYKGLSYLANVKYKINNELLDYLLQASLEEVKKLTGYKEIEKEEEEKLSIKLKKIWNKLKNDADNHIEYIKEKDEIYKKLDVIKVNKSKNLRLFNTLLYALTYSEINFSFHMFFDSRGRIYYNNTYISPQSSDLGKNLIEFANNEKVANIEQFTTLGYDYYKGRKNIEDNNIVIWSDSKVYEMAKTIDFKKDLFFESKSPIDYLNWFFAYQKVKENKDVKLHYIVKFDATCSGTQHISMLLKNIALARSVNIMNESNYGNDFYSEFVNFVKNKIDNKKSGVGLEKIKLISVRREIIKKTVMSYAYNAKPLSMSNDIRSFFDYKNEEYVDRVCGISLTNNEMKEYCNIIIKAIKSYSQPLTYFLTFLDLWAQILSYYNLEISWTLPELEKDEEIIVSQTYFKIEEKKVQIINFGRQTTISLKKTTSNIDTLKQRNTLAPNLVHSLDAFHVLYFCKTFTNDFRINCNIAVIHDCFGVNVKDSFIVRKVLYNTYKDMYKNTHILKDMHNKFIESLINNNIEVGYDHLVERHYIVILDYKKDPLKNLETDKNYQNQGLKKYLPQLKTDNEKEWIKAFEKDYKEIHSFTP